MDKPLVPSTCGNSGLKDGSGMTEPVKAKAMDSRGSEQKSWTLLLRCKPTIIN
ncbi:hypothetical protein CCACVL1_21651 [Corchorus capsularis]|uniref:Uncharacterized protein n=1 Tax=Corchorus capsularis TaxID=210143 RepID=A0A1R3H2S8_COCAP|nr:hypothetical protein CCACVL1_21651 [Corchorus capsularis]